MHAAVHASFTLSFVSGQQRKCVDAARSENVSCSASRHRMKTTRSNQSDLSPAVGSRWKERALCSVTCSILVLSITACAIQETPQQRAQRIEPILAAAGFNMIPADSDNKKTIVSSLAPLKLHYYIGKDGKPHYWFADPYECNCVYRGDETAYQRYQNLRLQQKMVAEQERAAELNQNAASQMNMYEPFLFPY
jgi:hypothetical protein